MSDVTVKVTLLNDDGDREEVYVSGPTLDEAIERAEEAIAERTGDDTYAMTEWEAHDEV